MTEEESLPYRRLIETVECEFEGKRFYLTLGHYPGMRIGEVYAEGFKHGSNIDLLVQDACALITELLQRFVAPETLLELMHRKPDGTADSLLGAILLEIVECDAELRGAHGQA